MESVFINAMIITEFMLESGLVLAGPTGPVPLALCTLFYLSPEVVKCTYTQKFILIA